MIKIIDLHKQYKSKKGPDHKALNGINLELGSKGFVLLSGDNETGNKTLLNIIGGLEKFDGGALLVNNTSIKSLTNENLNYYRNNYIGYILEDIGLFSHLTVSENLALELEFRGLNKEDIFKIVNETITRFNLQYIKDCLPSNLLKQEILKVKIASVIAKDSKIILVDSKIDVEIMEILKELSKEKLVIVASNNHRITQFSDRMIYFGSDSEIISDETINEHNLGIKEIEETLDLNKISLRLKSIFNYTRKWMKRNYITTLSLVVATLLFGLATNYERYDVGKVSAKTMYDNDISELVFHNGGYRRLSDCHKEHSEDVLSDLNYYKENYNNNEFYEVRRMWYLLDRTYHNTSYQNPKITVYDDVQHFESLLIYGDKITESTDVYITDYVANIIVEKSDEPIQVESLIGEEISLTTGLHRIDYNNRYQNLKFIKVRIAGIIDTDYKHDDYSEDIGKIIESEYNAGIEKIITSSENMQIIDKMVLDDSGVKLIEDISNSTYITTYFDDDEVVLLGDSKMPSNDNEVVIPFQYIIDIMISEGNEPPTWQQLRINRNNYLNEFINRKFSLKYDSNSGISEKELTIVGLYTDSDMSFDGSTNDLLIVNDDLYKDIYYNKLDIDLGVELGDDEKENIALFQSLDKNYFHNTLYSDAIYVLEPKTNNTQETLYKRAFALVLIAVVIEIISTPSKAETRKKQIRTLQSKGINPIRLFMMRGLMAWLITSIIGYLLLSVIMIGINLIVTNMYNISYFLPYLSVFSILTVIVVALIIHLGVALKEIYHIKRMN